MKIGIDCRTILDPKRGEQAGVGHYTYFLVKNLLKIDKKNKYVLYFDPKIGDASSFKQKNVEIKFLPMMNYKKYLPIIHSHFIIANFIDRDVLDIFHSPASTIPLSYPRRSIVTMHDLAIYHNRKWFPGGQRFSTKVVVPQTLKRVKKVIAVSEYTKKDILKYFKVPEEKVEVVYNGVENRKSIEVKDSEEEIKNIKEKFDIKKDFILFVGTIQPRKNINGLIKAIDKLRSARFMKDYQLVIAGGKGWDYQEVFDLVKEQALTKKVVFTDYVSKKDKFRLLKAASLFVFPSFYEGFGLSILEAMQQGTPVITSNTTSMPEVVGNAGLLINPKSVNSIANSIKKVLTDRTLKSNMVAKGYKQAEKFSWEKCARETLKIYKETFHG